MMTKTIARGLAVLLLAGWAALADANGDGWPGLAADPQHTGVSAVTPQPLQRVRWQTPVDLAPPVEQSDPPVHYGSPVITAGNTVIVPVKTTASGQYLVEGRNGADGQLVWSDSSDYLLPPHGWIPSFGPVLTANGRVYYPGGGGTLNYRDAPDTPDGMTGKVAFYGLLEFLRAPLKFYNSVMINTPLTADAAGNVFFGFQVVGKNPRAMVSGIARVDVDGGGVWISATSAAGNDPSITKVAHNSAPALSNDQRTLYVVVTDAEGIGLGRGYLASLDSSNLAPKKRIRLKDPKSGRDAFLPEASSASPTVGPDGDVYVGVLENPFLSNHGRGWLLHFNGALANSKLPGAFGWDTTASIVPASAVPFYTGFSKYLVMTNYNDYAVVRGSGQNRLAILDPYFAALDPISGVTAMREVTTIKGPTPDPAFTGRLPRAVHEWATSAAAVAPATRSVYACSEDGKLYRWDVAKALLNESVTLTAGGNQTYTPTLIGPDGAVYAISGNTLFAVGQ